MKKENTIHANGRNNLGTCCTCGICLRPGVRRTLKEGESQAAKLTQSEGEEAGKNLELSALKLNTLEESIGLEPHREYQREAKIHGLPERRMLSTQILSALIPFWIPENS